MPLRIRPVRLKQSIYFRVPNDIADLTEIDQDTEVTLGIEEQEDQFLLKYAVRKPRRAVGLESSGSQQISTKDRERSTGARVRR